MSLTSYRAAPPRVGALVPRCALRWRLVLVWLVRVFEDLAATDFPMP